MVFCFCVTHHALSDPAEIKATQTRQPCARARPSHPFKTYNPTIQPSNIDPTNPTSRSPPLALTNQVIPHQKATYIFTMARTESFARPASTVNVEGNATTNGISNSVADGVGQTTKVKAGMLSDVKNLYEGKPDNRGRTNWVDKYPDDIEEAAENAETAKFALLVRNKKCYDGRKTLQIDSIIVQSPLLKNALGHVLKDYPGVTTTLDRLTFKAPFKPFVHRWSRLVGALRSEEDEETKAHLDLFHHTMETELKDDLKARDDYILNKVITFETLWMIFEPGSIVFGQDDSQDCAFRLSDGRYVETRCGNAFQLDCQKVDWDGENFGFASSRLYIYQSLGTTPITKLSAFPLEYHRDLARVKKELVERGRAFERLAGYHYKHYNGVAVGQGAWGPVKYNVSHSAVPPSRFV